MDETTEKALALIEAFQSGLRSGHRYYNKAGEEQATAEAILRTLLREKAITFRASDDASHLRVEGEL